MDFTKLSARDIALGVKSKEFSALEIVEKSIELIKKHNDRFNAIVTLCEEEAIADAKRIDAEIAAGREVGLLAGVPFAVKDNFCTAGVETTCCSKMLKGWIPSYDATAVKLLKEAGAVLVGKANMDEFAMGSTTETSIFGATLNPRDVTRVPGGSSGGSAAAVAAGFVPIALGSDTGGSVRQPGAFCGVQAMKPSYGQISRYGIVAYASSLDQVGPMARNIEDLALVMNILAKTDVNDTTCDAYDRPSFTETLKNTNLAGKKVAVLGGYDKNMVAKPLSDAINKAVEICKAKGAEVIEAELPVTMEHAVACYYMVALGDASSKLACYDGMRYGHHSDGINLTDMYKKSRMEGFGEEVRKRILVGTCILTRGYYENYFIPATKVRRIIFDEFAALFKKADFMICPIAPTLPYKRGEVENNPVIEYLGDVFTTIANLAGLPSVSLNIGFTETGLPANIQLLGGRFNDDRLLAYAAEIEKAAGAPEAVKLD